MHVAWNLAPLAGPSFPGTPADLGPDHPGTATDTYNKETHIIFHGHPHFVVIQHVHMSVRICFKDLPYCTDINMNISYIFSQKPEHAYTNIKS